MDYNPRKWRKVRLNVWGDNACFTGPEIKGARVSFEVMTPAAAKGVLESIMWTPAIKWVVNQIDVLKPIRLVKMEQDGDYHERVEMEAFDNMLCLDSAKVNQGRVILAGRAGFFSDEELTQRAGLALCDVAYTIHAEFSLTDKAGSDDTVSKFSQIFRRRAGQGQCYYRPYLGRRDFPANFRLIDFDERLPEPIAESRDLGLIFYDFNYSPGRQAVFFRAEMVEGVIAIPEIRFKEA